MPVMAYTLALIIQICMMCFRMGPNLLTVSAVFKSLKSSFTRNNSNVVETIRRQALNEEESEELMEPTMFTGVRESGRTTEDPEKNNRKPEIQDRILMEKLEETVNRNSSLVAGQISLGARVASREESTSFSHGENP